MKFTLNWLKEFVDFDGSADELSKLLTMAGLEVESFTSLREPDNQREDWLFEISVTPNRGDCLGVLGIAREVSALTGGADVRFPPVHASKNDSTTRKRIAITIEEGAPCARYSARIVDGIEVAPSPAWLRFRLEACGIRAINRIVDATNYVMLETGQPLHAFDLARLTAGQIVVRNARKNLKFVTLDGIERELAPDDLVICDGDTPVAIAGVMGGSNSEVSDATQSILLESANFAPAAIRRTAKRLALHSEASHRFERGVDPEGTIRALDRTVQVLLENGGGHPSLGVADCYPNIIAPVKLRLRDQRIEKLLGIGIEPKRAETLLRSLGMKTSRHPKYLHVIVPTSRPDLTREVDLIEEVARLHGYDKIPTTLPQLRPTGGTRDAKLIAERKLRHFFAGEGFVETINLPFTSDSLNNLCSGIWEGRQSAVPLLNPLAKENSAMRQSLLPGLIESLRVNLAHKTTGFYGYQLGKVFRCNPEGGYEERLCVGAVMHGRPALGGLQRKEGPVNYLECKGTVEGLFDLFGVGDSIGWNRTESAILHPGRAAQIVFKEHRIGLIGELHPDISEQLEVPQVYVFELDFEKLLEYAPRQMAVRALPKFPSIERDFAIVVDRDFVSERIVNWIKNLGESLIEYVQVFDQYIGAPIPDGKKSLAYNISYRAEDRTLTDSEVNPLHQSLIDRIGKEFAVERRS
ncbi:MAG TPA: phenylalanine--tRNA ligase subunit beta [Candidatus Limnocylindrales bacterium]|nr:phenylalanine--tRNA ligase subunit beta [Candidatus Limnocylindrales bacterium]